MEVDRVGIQLELAELLQMRKLLGDHLGGIQEIESKGEGVLLVNNLHADIPLGAVAGFDGVPKVLAVVVGVSAGNDLGLLPNQAGKALLGLEVPFDELGVALFRDKTVRIDTEAVLEYFSLESPMNSRVQLTHHVTVAPWGAMTTHSPEESMQAGGLLAEEVPGTVVGSGSLRDLLVGPRVDGMDQVRLCECQQCYSVPGYSNRGRRTNWAASWMKNTGMLFPTTSWTPSSVQLQFLG